MELVSFESSKSTAGHCRNLLSFHYSKFQGCAIALLASPRGGFTIFHSVRCCYPFQLNKHAAVHKVWHDMQHPIPQQWFVDRIFNVRDIVVLLLLLLLSTMPC